MTPFKIQLKNFRGHSFLSIDLSNIEMAAVLGVNGVGKSSFVLAFVYALWGKCPKLSLEELVKHGEDNMEVKFWFIDQGQMFRIARSVRITGKKRKNLNSYLSLHTMLDEDTIGADISGNATGVTTSMIQEKLGGLTFDTALHSSFALQDEYSKFMDAGPTKRLGIYESILNVEVYDKLGQKARKRASLAKAVLDSVNENEDGVSKEDVEAEIKALDERKVELEEATARLNKTISSQNKIVAQLEVAFGKDIKEEDEKLESLKSDFELLQIKIKTLKSKIEEAKEFLADKETIEKQFNEFTKVEKEYLALCETAERYNACIRDLNVKEKLIEAEMSSVKIIKANIKEFEDENARVQNKLREKYDIDKDAKIQTSLKALIAELLLKAKEKEDSIAVIEAEIKKKRESGKDIQNMISLFKAANVQANKEKEKLSKIDGVCPYLNKSCTQISPDVLKVDIDSLTATINTNNGRIEMVKKQFGSLYKSIEEQEAAVSSLRKEREDIVKRSTVMGSELEKVTNEVLRLLSSIKQNKLRLREQEEKLVGIRSEKEAEILKKRAFVDFDIEKFEDLKVKFLKGKEDNIIALHQKLIMAEHIQTESNEKLFEMEANNTKSKAEIAKLEKGLAQKKEKQEKVQVDLDEAKANIENTKKELKEKQDSLMQVIADKAKRQLTIDRFVKKAAKMKEQAKIIETNTNLAKAYQMAKSFIVENSIPKYQDACNQVLDYLGLSIRVRIETLIQAKSRKTADLKRGFNIIIINGQGEERSYHTWSGGEKHRVNLALRHALSMLLLNRSGVRLGMVVIDEGDTKLDTEGKEALLKLIEGTNSGAFGNPAKVFFITHAEDLKDRLPLRLEFVSNKGGKTIVKVS